MMMMTPATRSITSRALMSALLLGGATASDPWEWKGIFYTPQTTYKWGAQKVSGAYADPTMKLAAIPASNASAAELTSAGAAGRTAMGSTCDVVNAGGTITPQTGKCFKLTFDQNSAETIFTVDATGVAAVAFFAEHLPTEFEDTAHYFKDTTGVDIEPVAQAPDGGHGHSHGHGGSQSKCVCQAQEHGWSINCNDLAKMNAAVAALDANTACKAANPPEACVDNYYLYQAHHDHCLHNQLPTGMEQKIHEYEQYYSDCFIKRQYNPSLGNCPAVTCDDATALTNAIQTLQNCAKTATACAATGCSSAMKTVLMAHDVCPESDLPDNLETALHDYEEPCEAQLCNSASAAFDPYAEQCAGITTTATLSGAGGLGSQKAFMVALLALPLAVCSLHHGHAM